MTMVSRETHARRSYLWTLVMESKTSTQTDNMEYWIETLMGAWGVFPQGKRKLAVPVAPGVIGMCCLGVMCEIYKNATGDGRWEMRDPFSPWLVFVTKRVKSENDSMPPEHVTAWFGFNDVNPTLPAVRDVDARCEIVTCSGYNDELRRTFPEIAAAVREKYLLPRLHEMALQMDAELHGEQ